MMKTADDYLSMAVDLAFQNVREHGGRPFGAVLVRNGTVLATGVNDTVATHDPSAHAEMQAIRVASQLLRNPRLDGCVIYASGHPCPMCLAAMHLTGIREVYFAYSNEDGEPFGLSTASLYEEMAKPPSQQSIKMEHRPVRSEDHLYAVWQRRRD